MKKITVIIPCFNEEKAIANVVSEFQDKAILDRGYEVEVIVIDNNSSDRTSEVALEAGARVIQEPKQGKGNAIRTGFYAVSNDTDFVVMIDGDRTYQPDEILRLVEPLDSGFADVIIGSRMAGRMTDGSMKGFNHLGNWMFSFLVRIFYKVNITDVLSGYFAWKLDAAIKLRPHLQSQGFAIEMEMITKMAKLDFEVYSVPISYEHRMGGSSLRPIRDGAGILKAFASQLQWKPKVERLAFVTDAVYPFNKGGKERRLHEIVKRLGGEGREIHIYTMKWWNGNKDIVVDGVHFHAICKFHPVYSGTRRSIKQALIYSFACFKLLGKKFDIVDVDQMPILPLVTMRIVCWLKMKKMYATWNEVWGKQYWIEYLGILGYFGWAFEYVSFKLPNVIITISQHTTDHLKALGVKKEIKTIPLGVDLASIISSPVNEFESDIIYVGRLMGHKNVDMLVRAVAKFKRFKKDVNCVIVGDGPEKAKIEKLVADLGLEKNVTMLEFIEDSTELFGIMKASKVFVLPSDREGFGLVTLEANACGLPVLTLDHPSNAATNLIHPGKNGDLFKNERALVRQLKKYFATDGRQELTSQVEEYDWSVTADLINKEYAS
jgi:glycosyltransferase involved in cell wall biosynthesis